MKRITKHIPNFITSLNLLCGIGACVLALQGDVFGVFLLLICAAVFDFFDGFASRLLNAYSALGKELDSLADMVSFGLTPGLLVYHILGEMTADAACSTPWIGVLPFVAFLLPIFSALRLAKFNIDVRQTSSFIGLNTPANALFWVSLSLCLVLYQQDALHDEFLFAGLLPSLAHQTMAWINIWVLVALIIFFSWVMVAEVPMFSLKMNKLSWSQHKVVYLFVMLSVTLVALMGVFGISICILTYIFFSLWKMRC